MAFIPLPDTIEVAMRFLYQGEQAVNVYHVQPGVPITLSELEHWGSVFVSWWDGQIAPNVPSTVSLQTISLVDRSTQFGLGIDYSTGLPLPGGASIPALPNNVTIAIRWGTGLKGRSFRGRTFHIGIGETQVSGNILDPGSLAPLLGAYTQLIDTVDTEGGTLVVASRYQGGAPRTTGVLTPIIGVSIDPTIDSMRKRLPGRGT